MDTSPRSENVKVVVRVRPLSETEKSAGYKTVVKVDSVNNTIILRAQNNSANSVGQSYNDVDRSFVFDSVFGQESSQVRMYFLSMIFCSINQSNSALTSSITPSDGSIQPCCKTSG